MDSDRRDRFLERVFLWNFIVHALGLVTMAALLLPMLPGGPSTDVERIRAIADHPWLFRLGWFPWQLCALFDLLLAIAMVRTAWLPRAGSWFVLVATTVAVVPDQLAQALWITRGVTLARTDPGAYLAFERAIFPLTASYGAMAYTAAAFGWTYGFRRAGLWSRAIAALSIPLWSLMVVASVSPILVPSIRPSPRAIAAVNALAFPLLQLWLALVGEQLLRRRRPFRVHGRNAPWRHPGEGIVPRFAELLANSRLVAALLDPLPALAMESDVTDVVYVNYLVDADRVALLVPEGLELQRLGPDGRAALVTFLTYRHGRFGFRFLGPLRRFMPSPIQSNWRIHVRDPRTGLLGIHFLTTGLSSTLFALGARLTAEAMPMHVFADAAIARDAAGVLRVRLDPGHGSAPDVEAELSPVASAVLPAAFQRCFPDFRAFLEVCVPQDRAFSTQPERGLVTRQEIVLGIPLDACEPLVGVVRSRAATDLVGDAEPLCFRVPSVRFLFLEEIRARS